MPVRWRRGSRLYLAASVVLAILAGVRVQGRVDAAGGGAANPDVPVLVATRHLARGTALGASDVRSALLPRAYAPPGALSQFSQAVGRVLLADLAAGEAVTETRLARVRAGPVAALVPPGLRAFAVPSRLPPAILRPGDRVDMLAAYPGRQHTELVVSGAEVLLVVGGQGNREGGVPPPAPGPGAGTGGATLIVLVAPQDQARLAHAQAFADLELSIAPAEPGGEGGM